MPCGDGCSVRGVVETQVRHGRCLHSHAPCPLVDGHMNASVRCAHDVTKYCDTLHLHRKRLGAMMNTYAPAAGDGITDPLSDGSVRHCTAVGTVGVKAHGPLDCCCFAPSRHRPTRLQGGRAPRSPCSHCFGFASPVYPIVLRWEQHFLPFCTPPTLDRTPPEAKPVARLKKNSLQNARPAQVVSVASDCSLRST